MHSGGDLSEYKINIVTQHWEFVEGDVVMMLGHVGDVASAFAEIPTASVCWCQIAVIIWHMSLVYFGFTRVL